MMNTGLSSRSRNRTEPAISAANNRGRGTSVKRSAGALPRRGHAGDDRVEQAVGSLPADRGLRSEQEPVAERWPEEPFHVIRRHVVAALECRRGFGGEQKEHLGSRACPQYQLGCLARGDGQLDDVASEPLIDGDLARLGLAFRDGGGIEDRLYAGPRRVAKLDAGIPAAEHLQLLLGGWVVHERLEQETVLLCLWQRIGPLVLDRDLRRQHHERVGQGKLLTLETDAPLLHRLEQRGLDLCRG